MLVSDLQTHGLSNNQHSASSFQRHFIPVTGQELLGVVHKSVQLRPRNSNAKCQRTPSSHPEAVLNHMQPKKLLQRLILLQVRNRSDLRRTVRDEVTADERAAAREAQLSALRDGPQLLHRRLATGVELLCHLRRVDVLETCIASAHCDGVVVERAGVRKCARRQDICPRWSCLV
jgi:hypothetical protein